MIVGCRENTFSNVLQKETPTKSTLPALTVAWNSKHDFVYYETTKQSKKKQKKNNSSSNNKKENIKSNANATGFNNTTNYLLSSESCKDSLSSYIKLLK